MTQNAFRTAEPKPADSLESAAKPSASFNDLVSQIARTKDKQAFVTVFDYFAPRVKGFLMRGGMSEQEAEELAQETMLMVWQKADQYNAELSSASTWIYTIARNKKIDRLRKNQFAFLDLDDLTASGLEPSVEAVDLDWNGGLVQERLTKAIDQLPPEQAELVQKAFYEDMSHAEIAKATALPLGTVKSRLRMGLAHLRKTLFES